MRANADRTARDYSVVRRGRRYRPEGAGAPGKVFPEAAVPEEGVEDEEEEDDENEDADTGDGTAGDAGTS